MAKQIKGILGEKLGMTQVWDENNRVVPVTVVKAGLNVVTQVRTNDSDGYESVQIAFGEIDPRKVNKPLKGHFAKADVTPRRHLVEIRTAGASEYTLGQEITAEVFEAYVKVDVTGKSKGKGFAGVMKRHNFKGLGAGFTVSSASTALPAPSVAVPPRAVCSRASAWRAAWATSGSPPRT